ncbi:hypothetical protein Vi05172_g6017 [Venturia inaequalis]|nr:hypothetical protein Vi05172_g6017 [Venturia inaequalis]
MEIARKNSKALSGTIRSNAHDLCQDHISKPSRCPSRLPFVINAILLYRHIHQRVITLQFTTSSFNAPIVTIDNGQPRPSPERVEAQAEVLLLEEIHQKEGPSSIAGQSPKPKKKTHDKPRTIGKLGRSASWRVRSAAAEHEEKGKRGY